MEREKLISGARAYASAAGLEEKLRAAVELQKLVLGCAPEAAARSVKENSDTEYVQAVLVASRPGVTALPCSTHDANRLAAVRLGVYQAVLGLLGAQPLAPTGSGSQEGADNASAAAAASSAPALTERQAADLVSVLDCELGTIGSSGDLSEVVEAAFDAFQSDGPLGCAALELLPKALALLQAMGGEVDVPSGEGTAAACQVSDVCKAYVGRVIEHGWPLAGIGRVLAALRSFQLSQDQLRAVVKKAGERARVASPQDLPAVVHQLLMLSTRGCRELILGEIVRLFEYREQQAADSPHQGRQLQEVQGAVLLHIDMAAKHDAELGQAWLRQLRAEAPPRLTPFALALSFTLAAMQRFEQPVTDALKAVVLGAFKDAASVASCPWLPFPSSKAAAELGAGQVAALRDSLLRCARCSGHAQAGMVQPMVALAVALIEAGGGGTATIGAAGRGLAAAAAAAAAATEAAAPADAGGGGGATAASMAPPAQRASSLGVRLLLELFEAHRDFRKDLVSLCHLHLLGAREEVAAPYVRLLALLVRRNQATIGDQLPDMKLSLEHLAFLPPGCALALLLAVAPLCRARRDAQDYLAMLLRKAMFSRELHSRLLAARGFLHMVTQELMHGGGAGGAGLDTSQPGPSQVPMSQLASLSGGGGGGTLSHEAMSFLRRCLTQQPEVRCVVYDGLPALLAADPSVQDAVVEPLLPHFHAFYEEDEQLSPPLKLEACARAQGEGARLVEPLPHLLAAVRSALLAGGGSCGGDDADGAAAALRLRFAALRRRLADSTLEDFHLDASQDFNLASSGGQLGQASAGLLLGCMEVAMEDLLGQLTGGAAAGSEGEEEVEDPEDLAACLLRLHREHQRLEDLVAAQCKGGRGKKGEGLTQAVGGPKRGPSRPPLAAAASATSVQQSSVVGVDQRVPVLSLACLAKMLDGVADDGFALSNSAGTPATDLTRELCRSTDFIAFALTSALRRLHACEASELAGAIATGTAGSEADAVAAKQLFAVPEWQELARPIFRAAQTVLLSHCKPRVAQAAGSAGLKKEKDASEAVTQAAASALHQLLSMGAAGGLASVAAVLRRLPPPSAAAAEEAGLPALDGLDEEQLAVAAALPLFHELLVALLKPSCARELEQLCSGLAAVAPLLARPLAAAVAGWAVEGLERITGLTQVSAAKALLQLALRGRAAAAAPDGGGVVTAADSGDGNNVSLLLAIARDIHGMLNAEVMLEEGERFGALTARTYQGMLGVAGSHLEAVLGTLDWALAKVRAMGAAARAAAGEGAAARSNRLEVTRRAWERAVLARLRAVAEVLAVLCDTPLTGSPCDMLLKALTRLFKLLATAAKTQALPRGAASRDAKLALSTAFTELVAWVNKSCTPAVYSFVQEVHGAAPGDCREQENQGTDSNEDAQREARKRARAGAAAANRAKRESRQVPALIFQIEEFERHLILLSTQAGVNLMASARRATNRDFKIELEPREGGEEANGEPRGKRARQQAHQPPRAHGQEQLHGLREEDEGTGMQTEAGQGEEEGGETYGATYLMGAEGG